MSIALFLPAAFLPGLTGRIYAQFALVIAATALLSAINAATLKPTQLRFECAPRAASTIMLLRDGLTGLEVFMVVRHHEIDFASGALVLLRHHPLFSQRLIHLPF